MNCEYVAKYYGVPACVGRRVSFRGRAGIITKDRGNYIGVTFDDEKPQANHPIHPKEDGLEYLDMGQPRKLTRAQARYQRYLDVADYFDSFRQFLRSQR